MKDNYSKDLGFGTENLTAGNVEYDVQRKLSLAARNRVYNGTLVPSRGESAILPSRCVTESRTHTKVVI